MFGTTTRMTFQGVKQCRTVKTFCTGCGKKLTRVLTTTYYRNGFHDEAKTRAENDAKLDRDAKKLEKNGTTCKACDNVA